MSTISGKGFGANTLILMHDGSTKKVKDIEIGDEIMSPNGCPITINEIIKKQDELYDIIQAR